MKIFDCFIYNDEDLILELRFNILDKFVDKFVVVEAKFDHQNNPKKTNFKVEKFEKFRKKIKYVVLDIFPENLSNWGRENYQRNFISQGLEDANDEDYIIISDADEIPNLEEMLTKKLGKYTAFKQKLFYYKINLLNKTEPFWYGSKICKKKYLKSPQWLRDQKVKNYSFWKFYKIKWNIVENGGWHFSFLKTPEEIQKKIKQYAHAEFNMEKYTDLERIKNSIKNKIDLFDRHLNFQRIEINNNFPRFIVENKELYKDWII
tara:strand:+ start:295 stop:1080 length:786 start_codon:yes stop_codon:yes gene_type:complete